MGDEDSLGRSGPSRDDRAQQSEQKPRPVPLVQRPHAGPVDDSNEADPMSPLLLLLLLSRIEKTAALGTPDMAKPGAKAPPRQVTNRTARTKEKQPKRKTASATHDTNIQMQSIKLSSSRRTGTKRLVPRQKTHGNLTLRVAFHRAKNVQQHPERKNRIKAENHKQHTTKPQTTHHETDTCIPGGKAMPSRVTAYHVARAIQKKYHIEVQHYRV